MHTISIPLLLVLSNSVLCNPLTYLNDDQSGLKRSLSNLPCPLSSGDYNWQISFNATEPQNSTVGNQTTFADTLVSPSNATENLIQGVSLLSTATLPSSITQPTAVSETRCQIIARVEHSDYVPSSIDVGPYLLRPDISARYLIRIESSYPVFRLTVRGRLPDAPDDPYHYYLIYADNTGNFSLQREMWVKINIAFASEEPKGFQFTLYRVILTDQNLVAA